MSQTSDQMELIEGDIVKHYAMALAMLLSSNGSRPRV